MEKIPGFETTITADPTSACRFWENEAPESVGIWGPPVLEGGIYNIQSLASSITEIATDIVWDGSSWWYWDPVYAAYLVTSERRVDCLYRRIVIHAGETSGSRSVKSVTYPLVGLARPVIDAARDLLWVDASFWDRNPRIIQGKREGISSLESVSAFASAFVMRDSTGILTLNDAHSRYSEYCRQNGTIPITKGRFGEELSVILRERFSISLRHDLRVNDGVTRGWRRLGLKNQV